MTPDEIIDLLSIAATFDKRSVGESDVYAWSDAADRGRWTFDEAAEAVRSYYATTTHEKPWVMPSHITNAIKADRQDKAMRNQAAEQLRAGPPHPRVAAMIEQIADTKAVPALEEPVDYAHPARVQCPHCKAAPGQRCSRPSIGGPKPTQPHPSRIERAKAQRKAVS